jgi:hypothetical protein
LELPAAAAVVGRGKKKEQKKRGREKNMGRLYLIQLDGRIYSCKHCRSHLANSDELLSRVIASFSSRFFPLLFWNFVCGLFLLPFLMVYYHMVFCVTWF